MEHRADYSKRKIFHSVVGCWCRWCSNKHYFLLDISEVYICGLLILYKLSWISCHHQFHPTWLSLLLCVTIYRLELQHGFSIPVSQLEGVCGRMRPALCVCCSGTYLYARKSQILPWGKCFFLNCYSLHTEKMRGVVRSDLLNYIITVCFHWCFQTGARRPPHSITHK